MKYLFISILIMAILSCQEPSTPSHVVTKKPPEKDSVINDTATISPNWINSFEEFRTAIVKKNKQKLRQFIDFPLRNENNELWFMVYRNNKNALGSLGDAVKPFTEKDLDKYFDKVFPPKFVFCLSKMNKDEFFKKNNIETQEYKLDSTHSYKMYGVIFPKEKLLTLNLDSITFDDMNIDEGENVSELNLVYHFDVMPDGQLKFRKIRIAG